MKILGIDSSLTSTGLALIEDDELLEHRTIKTKAKEDWYVRIERIKRVTREWTAKADYVGLENYAFGSRFNREVMAEVGGNIKYDLCDDGFKPLMIAPSQVKKYITGNGRASKDDVIQNVKEKHNIEFKTSDEADAFVIALITRECIKVLDNEDYLETMPEKQKEVIKKLLEEELDNE